MSKKARSRNNLPLTTRASTSIAIFKNELETFYHSPYTQPHFSHGPGNPATHLTRLRLNRSQLNFYLFQHQCVPSPACKCGHSIETACENFPRGVPLAQVRCYLAPCRRVKGCITVPSGKGSRVVWYHAVRD
ncbi:hypothetical protein Bbelb_276640 [Branchiostoma belcheri]|nr:hypothetical protein Bbelb_276640 [Branchiostoma belcheri]